ncbi:hypothetical protein UPYG_G00067350 [Umbra pygmaea]|uniref:C2H2-type domain-containing protein n=1 Tax=Umbra pygmaea TaxID=75934 RepID=A0ABD0XEE6_UMBPY
MQFSLSVCEDEVPPEQQHCEQEWSPSLGQELDPIQIKEEQEDLRTSQEKEQLQCLDADNTEFSVSPSCVKSECDQVNSIQCLSSAQTQTVGNRETEAKPVDITPLISVAHIKKEDTACDLPDNQNIFSNHTSVVSNNPVGLDSCSLLDPHPSVGEQCSKPSTTSGKLPCRFGELFALKADMQRHVTPAKKRPSDCFFCKKRFNSTCKLKAHVRLCHVEKPCICLYCCKNFQNKGHLSRHMRIHTGEKPFCCGDCGKTFNQKGHLIKHVRTHTGEKPFSCGECGKSFNRRDTLNLHILNHTGDKLFSCDFCNKKFSQKGILTKHVRTHTGEKPFNCSDCRKSFLQKGDLRRHMLTHTGEKPFRCGECGEYFNRKDNLNLHVLTHENIHKQPIISD